MIISAANPHIDWLALAPELTVSGVIFLIMGADFLFSARRRWQTSFIASIGVLVALIPVFLLAVSDQRSRSMFGGAYVVDNYAIALKAFFLIAVYIVILLAVNYIAEGAYYQAEFWALLLFSVLGMMVMASARDLVTIFVALEMVSIPTYVLAAWRKHDLKSNEAAIKYFLIGALSTAVMLYGMSFVFGLAGSTKLSDIAGYLASTDAQPLFYMGIFFTLVGFAFKISAVPFHFWAPDTYEGAPTPVTAFLSVLSKAAGFAALVPLVLIAFYQSQDAWQPVLWALAAASMTLGNLAALRQTNVVRLLAYSSIAQGGFILVPLAVAAQGRDAGEFPTSALEAVIIYLLIYGLMNLGAFAVVIAVARRTGSAELDSYRGFYHVSPAITLVMALFMFSLAGIPPLGGWFAKFVMFRAVLDAGTPLAITLGVIAAVNTIIAFFYYSRVVRVMIMSDLPEKADRSPLKIPAALSTALVVTAVPVVVLGVLPQLFARIGELSRLTF